MINVALSMNAPSKARKNTAGKHRHTISLTDPDVAKFAKKKAGTDYDGKLSRYVRTLIRKDMETVGEK
jgi:hypothetical protein